MGPGRLPSSSERCGERFHRLSVRLVRLWSCLMIADDFALATAGGQTTATHLPGHAARGRLGQ
jgi:hypothetical protein